MVFLDFEAPVKELYAQLDEMRQLALKSKVDLSDKIRELEERIKTAQKELYSNLSSWQRVQVARHPERPYTLYYAEKMCKRFIELHGDRTFRDDKAIVGGLAVLDGQTVMIIGHQKGINTKMRQYRNFGMANPEGYRKALRMMKLAERFGIPVITLIDTPGAFPGIEAEERGQAEAIARNLFEMAQLRTPIICVIIGEGASGGALGIGVGDRVFMLENTWYTVISPESCSSILWRSWDYKEQAAEQLRLTPDDMFRFRLIDGIIKEPVGGAHAYPEDMAKILKRHLKKELAELRQIPTDQLIEQRIAKFAAMGQVDEYPND